MTRHIILFLTLLLLSAQARAAAVVTISSAQGTPGSEVQVAVSVQSDSAFSALQLRIPLPAGLEVVDTSAQVTTRAASHSVSVGVKDSVLQVFLFSTSMATVAPGAGAVLTFSLRLGRDPQVISLNPSRVTLLNAAGKAMTATATGGTVTVVAAKAAYSSRSLDYGHIPIRQVYTQNVTVTNVGTAPLQVTALQFSSDRYSCSQSLPFSIAAGGRKTLTVRYAPVKRGKATETMQVVCNSTSKLNTIALHSDPFAVNELHMLSASGESDSTVTLHFTMNNMDSIMGLQMDFKLPSALQYVDGSFALTGRSQGHVVTAKMVGDTLRCMAYAVSGKPLRDTIGEVATLRVKLTGRYGVYLEPVKARLVALLDGKPTDVLSAKYGANVDIIAPQISCNSELDMGSVPVTETAEAEFNVSDYGSGTLLVNRVTFDDTTFVVTDSLPLRITSWNSQSLHLRYAGTSEGKKVTNMYIYTNDPEQRMTRVTVTLVRFAPNSLAFEPKVSSRADTVTVAVNLVNYDPISGIQFDVLPPAGFTPAEADGDATGMGITTRQLADTVRYYCYRMNGKPLRQWAGRAVDLKFAVASTVAEGDYEFQVSGIKMGTAQLQDKCSEPTATFTVNLKRYLEGDLNHDGIVNVTDVSLLVNWILNPTVANFEEGDLTHDGKMNVTDVSYLVNLILNP